MQSTPAFSSCSAFLLMVLGDSPTQLRRWFAVSLHSCSWSRMTSLASFRVKIFFLRVPNQKKELLCSIIGSALSVQIAVIRCWKILTSKTDMEYQQRLIPVFFDGAFQSRESYMKRTLDSKNLIKIINCVSNQSWTFFPAQSGIRFAYSNSCHQTQRAKKSCSHRTSSVLKLFFFCFCSGKFKSAFSIL